MAKQIGIRRWGDRCYHVVEEEYEDGYVVDGIFIHQDDVVDTVIWDDEVDGPPECETGDDGKNGN